ncbi:MAG: MinD/ParA family protein [Polaromonas sp.]|nr:MinD/ParA family protein [Polaromonas sp.]
MENSSQTQVICIASGKGGVGKTVVSANLSVALQRMGKRVMLLDADLDMANAHIALGAQCVYNLSHFLSGEKTLEEIIVTTRAGVRLVPGASGLQGMAAISHMQAASIVQAFSAIKEDLDYLIVDMAAGISPSTLAFIMACQRRFVVVRDDPLSIADAFATVKVLMRDYGLSEVYLLPNGMNSQQEGRLLFDRINQVCARFLGQSIHYVGTVEHDGNILSALRKSQSVIEFSPNSVGAKNFERLAVITAELEPISYPSGVLEFFIERLVKKNTLARDSQALNAGLPTRARNTTSSLLN